MRVYATLSFCSNDTDDIVVPTYKATLSTVFGKDLENVKDVDGKCHTVGGGWASKATKLFWRGRDSSKFRVHFVDEVFAPCSGLSSGKIFGVETTRSKHG